MAQVLEVRNADTKLPSLRNTDTISARHADAYPHSLATKFQQGIAVCSSEFHPNVEAFPAMTSDMPCASHPAEILLLRNVSYGYWL